MELCEGTSPLHRLALSFCAWPGRTAEAPAEPTERSSTERPYSLPRGDAGRCFAGVCATTYTQLLLTGLAPAPTRAMRPVKLPILIRSWPESPFCLPGCGQYTPSCLRHVHFVHPFPSQRPVDVISFLVTCEDSLLTVWRVFKGDLPKRSQQATAIASSARCLQPGSVERHDLFYGVRANLRQRRPDSFIYHSHRGGAGVADSYVRIIPVTTLRLDWKINNADVHALKQPAGNIVSIPKAVSYTPLPSGLSVQTSTQRIGRTLSADE